MTTSHHVGGILCSYVVGRYCPRQELVLLANPNPQRDCVPASGGDTEETVGRSLVTSVLSHF